MSLQKRRYCSLDQPRKQQKEQCSRKKEKSLALPTRGHILYNRHRKVMQEFFTNQVAVDNLFAGNEVVELSPGIQVLLMSYFFLLTRDEP